METSYIQIPSPSLQSLAKHQGKALYINPAKRDEVPVDYRKKRIVDYLPAILLYAVGFGYFCKNLIIKGR